MESIKRLTPDLLVTLADQARHHPRLRQNYNFHTLSDKVQRMLNMLQPGTYIRPHRHLRSDGDGFEFFLVLQGALGILLFDAQGQVRHQEILTVAGSVWALELPEGTYHTLVALLPDTVILELKEGPYQPNHDKDFLAQFPAEGTTAAQDWVQLWHSYFEKFMAELPENTPADDKSVKVFN